MRLSEICVFETTSLHHKLVINKDSNYQYRQKYDNYTVQRGKRKYVAI